MFTIGAYFTKIKGRLVLNIAIHKKDDIGSMGFGIMTSISLSMFLMRNLGLNCPIFWEDYELMQVDFINLLKSLHIS
jgi:hypothetical protein